MSFSVRRGELFALFGTNGAVKTSTREVLEGIAPATSGAVQVLGHDPFRGTARPVDRLGVRLLQHLAGQTGRPSSVDPRSAGDAEYR